MTLTAELNSLLPSSVIAPSTKVTNVLPLEERYLHKCRAESNLAQAVKPQNKSVASRLACYAKQNCSTHLASITCQCQVPVSVDWCRLRPHTRSIHNERMHLVVVDVSDEPELRERGVGEDAGQPAMHQVQQADEF